MKLKLSIGLSLYIIMIIVVAAFTPAAFGQPQLVAFSFFFFKQKTAYEIST